MSCIKKGGRKKKEERNAISFRAFLSRDERVRITRPEGRNKMHPIGHTEFTSHLRGEGYLEPPIEFCPISI